MKRERWPTFQNLAYSKLDERRRRPAVAPKDFQSCRAAPAHLLFPCRQACARHSLLPNGRAPPCISETPIHWSLPPFAASRNPNWGNAAPTNFARAPCSGPPELTGTAVFYITYLPDRRPKKAETYALRRARKLQTFLPVRTKLRHDQAPAGCLECSGYGWIFPSPRVPLLDANQTNVAARRQARAILAGSRAAGSAPNVAAVSKPRAPSL